MAPSAITCAASIVSTLDVGNWANALVEPTAAVARTVNSFSFMVLAPTLGLRGCELRNVARRIRNESRVYNSSDAPPYRMGCPRFPGGRLSRRRTNRAHARPPRVQQFSAGLDRQRRHST